MKKLTAISMILIYCSTQLGMIAIYCGKSLIHLASSDLQTIRKVIYTDGKNLVQLTLDTARYGKKVRNGEISLNGVLYDIAGKKITGSTVSLSLEKDEVETMLMNQYDHLINWVKKHHRSKSSDDYVLDWMLKLYFFSKNSNLPNWTYRTTQDSIQPPKYLSVVYSAPPAKPPEQ